MVDFLRKRVSETLWNIFLADSKKKAQNLIFLKKTHTKIFNFLIFCYLFPLFCTHADLGYETWKKCCITLCHHFTHNNQNIFLHSFMYIWIKRQLSTIFTSNYILSLYIICSPPSLFKGIVNVKWEFFFLWKGGNCT